VVYYKKSSRGCKIWVKAEALPCEESKKKQGADAIVSRCLEEELKMKRLGKNPDKKSPQSPRSSVMAVPQTPCYAGLIEIPKKPER
jgi:hypothetical protein